MLLEVGANGIGTRGSDDIKEWTIVKDYSELKRIAEDRELVM